MNLPKPSAVIFDWDNTLVNTWPIIHAALNATFAEMGKPLWTFDMTKQRVRKSMRDSFPEIFGPDWEKAGAFYQQQYRNNHLLKLEALEGAEALLALIKEAGLYNVVVSNKKGPNLRQEVTHLGWDHYFRNIVGADDAARDKPFRDPVELAFAGSEHTPGGHVWFIGDSDIDLECAMNTGCTAILYGPTPKEHGNFTPTHFQEIPYHFYAPTHTELVDLFKRFA
ncbi:MAG: HAD hydrolase-like protein [Alphaproteobacteria bacterium]|nr:HAD hydrolase-like protein [Alphaproteobacteria bacterium]